MSFDEVFSPRFACASSRHVGWAYSPTIRRDWHTKRWANTPTLRAWLSFCSTLILLYALAGCDKGSTPPATSTTPPPLPEVRLGYFANVTHAQAVLEVASGELQNALGPTKLTTKVFNAGPELMQALNAGAIDVAYVGPGPVISEHVNTNGQAIRVISGSAANGVVIVASKNSGIQSMSQLKDKLIATPQLGNTQDVSARHYVTAVLGQPDADNVKGIPNSQQSGLMARGAIDAAWEPEPWGARLIDQTGAVLVGEEKDLWPNHEFSLTVVVTTPDFLANHSDVLEKILTVHRTWTARLRQNPTNYAGQLNDALVALGGKKLPENVMQDALKRTEFTDDPLPDTFATMEQWSYNLKFIKSAPPLTGLFATDIINKLDQAPAATQP
jgi:NitT/TauT family transport system substrate-binding protein